MPLVPSHLHNSRTVILASLRSVRTARKRAFDAILLRHVTARTPAGSSENELHRIATKYRHHTKGAVMVSQRERARLMEVYKDEPAYAGAVIAKCSACLLILA